MDAKTQYIKEAISEAFYEEGIAELFDTLPIEKQDAIARSLEISIDCMSMNFDSGPSASNIISDLQKQHKKDIEMAVNSVRELSNCCDAEIMDSFDQMAGRSFKLCLRCDRYCSTHIKHS